MSQRIISGNGCIKELNSILRSIKSEKFMLVCDSSFPFLSIKNQICELDIPFVSFSEFTPNPIYEDVVKGVDLFQKANCDVIMAVGGGSTIDVAKCIKLYSKMDSSKNYLEQEYNDSGIPLIAIPTTAGTGSESTRYAVVYFKEQKQSITHESIIPNYVLLEPSVLKTLPVYQKKCTMLDALCQGIESWWSINSNDESKAYSKIAVESIIKYMDSYIYDNDELAAEKIMLAANYSGRAINITQTTAAHAMSYKLTSIYNLPHGHAVSICLPYIWRFMSDNTNLCVDPRGEKYLQNIFSDISRALCSNNPTEAIDNFTTMLKRMQIIAPNEVSKDDLHNLIKSVNPTRLKNNPVELNASAITLLYKKILSYGSDEERNKNDLA
ncbi:MAG: phosphonoacetaldehyde reductase [Eubacteriales bacterium]|nr:phosphonoacetaldehyde reductase [Eubacteriales bacterium]